MDRRISISELAGLVIMVAAIYIGYDQYKQYQAQVAIDKLIMQTKYMVSPQAVDSWYKTGHTLKDMERAVNGR